MQTKVLEGYGWAESLKFRNYPNEYSTYSKIKHRFNAEHVI